MYWSAMGMSGHKSVGPLRACVKVVDCCDPSFAGTLTHVKMIEICVRAFSPPLPNDSQ
jgi:hypothetical protein